MADALLGSTVQVLVEKAINLASEQISQFASFKKALEKLKKMLTRIQAILHDAERKQVTEEPVKLWLEDLERVALDANNLLDDVDYEMIRRRVEIQNQMKRKVRFFFSLSNPIAFRCKMAKKIQEINMDLKRINKEAMNYSLQPQIGARDAPVLSPPRGGYIKNRETDSVTIDTSFVGRDDDVSAIVTKLTVSNDSETISVFPIVGMGGIGKTALARKVFNNLQIEKHFDKRIWVCVSEDFNAIRLFGLILESLQGREPEAKGREAKVKQLKQLLNGEKPLKYLLVLDDVWNDDREPWKEFLGSMQGISSAKGSWILVTTRNQRVATIPRIPASPFCLEKLSDDNCRLILEKNAFDAGEAPDHLKELGLKLAKKCQGLPLAASVLGGMLRNKRIDEWHSILDTGLQNLGGDENSYVTKILELSVHRLPYPALKKCFAYCSIFPKNFQIERDQLIQLWEAEGFLHSNIRNHMHMEKIGDIFFSILLDSNLLQNAKKDEYGRVLSCEMHDLVHYLVQSLSRSKTLRLTESRRVDYETFPIQYLALEGSGEEMPFPSAESFKNITTLFLSNTRLPNDRQISFFMLRVLNLMSSGVQELPISIGKLTHLRYLDLSGTSIKILPESLCQLYNLQTLRVRNCYLLTKFPFNFKNLVNLRHFDLDLFKIWCKSSVSMPLKIGQLHFLQTLPFFNVGEEKGRQIEELKSLENLSGRLEIRNLELVKNKEESKSANLMRKPKIDELRLSWNELANQRKDDNECNQVLVGLQPHQNLKGLIIERFFGDQLSTWIGKLDKLVKFEIINCKNCKELPTLGHMPFLRSLHLEGLDGVTSIGTSFYEGSTVHSGSSNQRPIKLFPALEHFILRDMLNLTKWMEAADHSTTKVVFPILETIKIYKCPKLTTFPSHFPHLKELDVKKTNNGSALMTYICSGVSTLISLCIWNVNELIKLPNILFQTNPNLIDLELRECPDLIQFKLSQPRTCIDHNATQNLVGLESLEKLVVRSCHSLKSISIPRGDKYLTALRRLSISLCSGLTQLSIPQISESVWDSTSSSFSSSSSRTCTLPPPLPLEELYVFQCPNLVSFPIDFTRTPSLSSLDISQCERLTDLPKGKLCSLTSLRILWIGPFSQTTELHSFLDLFDAVALQPLHYYFPSLSELVVYGWPHWESLPKQLQQLSALTYLYLNGFGVKSLPDWFGKLSSLEQLWLHNCEKLENLPSHQSMRSLAKLSELRIQGCPLLEERCKRKSSSSTDPNSENSSSTEWSKISHTAYLSIDRQLDY